MYHFMYIQILWKSDIGKLTYKLQHARLTVHVCHKTLYLKSLISILPLHIAWSQHIVAELPIGCGSPIIWKWKSEIQYNILLCYSVRYSWGGSAHSPALLPLKPYIWDYTIVTTYSIPRDGMDNLECYYLQKQHNYCHQVQNNFYLEIVIAFIFIRGYYIPKGIKGKSGISMSKLPSNQVNIKKDIHLC